MAGPMARGEQDRQLQPVYVQAVAVLQVLVGGEIL